MATQDTLDSTVAALQALIKAPAGSQQETLVAQRDALIAQLTALEAQIAGLKTPDQLQAENALGQMRQVLSRMQRGV